MIKCNSRLARLLKASAAILFSVLALGDEAFALDKRKISWYALDVWRQPQGLPQNSVLSLCQTRDGYIWLGTRGGLSRFDGVRFITFDDRNKDQLRENEVWALQEGDDTSLWIGTYGGGLSRLKNGKFTVYTAKDGLIYDYVTSLCKDSLGAIWIGTDRGVSRFTEEPADNGAGEFISYTVKDGLPSNGVRTLYADTDGSILIGTTNGEVCRFKGDRIRPIPIEGPKPTNTIRTFCRDRYNALWIGTTNGLFRVKDGKSVRYTASEGLSSNRVTYVHEDESGNIWLGTDSGLNGYRAGRIRPVDGGIQDLSNDSVYVIRSDREGNLWVGLMSRGLIRLREGLFSSYNTHDGLADNYVSSVLQDMNDNLWFGTARGLNCFRGGEFTTYFGKANLPVKSVMSLAEDRAGNIWVGTDDGLYRTESGSARVDSAGRLHFIPIKQDMIQKLYVRVIFEDRDGAIWIGANNEGLLKYQFGKFTVFTTREGLANNSVRGLCQDRNGNLWIATKGGGLNRFKDGTFTTYTSRDGLASDGVQMLYLDREDTLWIGTRQGLNRLKDGKFTTYLVRDGLFANYVYNCVEDNRGNLWMNSSKGVFRVSKQELNDFAEGKIQSVTSAAYGLEHGLSSTVGTIGHCPGSFKARDGRIWFGTVGGASVVDPDKLSSNLLAPPVHIEEVSVDHRIVNLDQKISAPPGRGDLEFHYAGLSFMAPDKVRFRYKLEGYDRSWIDAGGRRTAYYNNIPPGQYTFRVVASNNDGVWNEVGDRYPILLAAHFYQTYWFLAICVFSGAILILGIFRLRIRSLKAHEQQLEILVDRRTSELQDQRTFLRKVIDLNPSFIFAKDRQGRFTLANRALAEAYGTSVDELIGKTDHEFNQDATQVETFRRDDLEIIKSKTEKFIPEEEFTDKSGDLHWMQVIKIPMISTAGEADQVLGVATDITLQKTAKEAAETATREMHEAKEAAESATRAKSSFLANMSHEIRTPMNAVIGMTGLLLDTELTAEQRDFVETIRTGGDSLLTVINDILDFSKIESGKLDLEHQPFRLSACIEEVLDLLAVRAAEKGLKLAYEIDGAAPVTMVGDITRLRQILVNLVSNAVKFTHQGEVVVSVSADAIRERRYRLHFGIRDTGIGIPAEKIGLLFQSFSQIDSSTTRQYGGTGLGLAISSRLTEMMGGRMWVESEIGIGSTFHFTIEAEAILPSGIEPTETGQQSVSAAKLNGDLAHRPPLRILLAEDNVINQRVALKILQRIGYRADVAGSGLEVLDALGRQRYDIVLMDVQMPEMDGLEASRTILERWVEERRPWIIAMTANAMQGDREECLAAGMNDYISKPVRAEDLAAALQRSQPALKSVPPPAELA